MTVTVHSFQAEVISRGARMLRMEDRIGSLKAGKQADLVLVRTDTLPMAPAHDPIGALVLGLVPDCPVEHVRSVGNAAGGGAVPADRVARPLADATVTAAEAPPAAGAVRFEYGGGMTAAAGAGAGA